MALETIFQFLLAVFLGGLIGLEREIKKKEAGLQTYSLVALGSCLLGAIALSLDESGIIADPSPVFIAIGIGMGFIGAGTIFHKEGKIEGLTTAAGLWVTAMVGLAVANQLYFLGAFVTFLILLIFAGFGYLEGKIFKSKSGEIK